MRKLEILNDVSVYPENFIRFLGTAGTRFIMLTQRRATGGIWFRYGMAQGVIDPGPGSLVRICEARPALSPTDINSIVVTHRHIDHSCDLNVLVEGMTLGSRGVPFGNVILPRDCLKKGEAVLLRYIRSRIERVKCHRDGKRRRLPGGVTVEPVPMVHDGVECYGVIFRADGLPTWGLISDTSAQPYFAKRYADCELLVINTSLVEKRGRIDHMSMSDVAGLLSEISPKLVLLTHMGPSMLDRDPREITLELSTARTRVVPAWDGLVADLKRKGD